MPALAHPAAFTVKSGAHFTLDATGSSDPDGDSLGYWWSYYPEAGTYRGPLTTGAAQNNKRVPFVAPQVYRPVTAHFILRVTDKGRPALTRYKRVIVTFEP